MPANDKSSLDQRARFIEAARQLDADKDDGTLARLLGKVAPPVRPRTPPQDTKVGDAMTEEGRIPERTISQEALKLLAQAPDGFMTTTDLIAALDNQFEPSGEDAEILEGRSDTRFSQKVRNLVSHRGYPNGLETNGYAVYDKSRSGWTITPAGRTQT
jgi:hypothetical protein